MNNSDWWEGNDAVIGLQQSFKGLTGIIFFVLAIAILNYGTKLETAISQSALLKRTAAEKA